MAAGPAAVLGVLSPRTVDRVEWGTIAVLAVITVVQLRRQPIPTKELARRVPPCIAGLCCFGVGIALFFKAHLGNAPWDVLHGGLSKRTGLPVGVIINLLGLLVLALWIPLKERIGLGTVLNALIIGLVVDAARDRMHDAHAPWLQFLMTVAGTVTIAVGSGLYIGSRLGAGPRDGLMLGVARLGLSVSAARTVVEVGALVSGLALGGRIGVGTVVFVVLIGPAVQFLLPRLAMSSLAVDPTPEPIGPTA